MSILGDILAGEEARENHGDQIESGIPIQSDIPVVPDTVIQTQSLQTQQFSNPSPAAETKIATIEVITEGTRSALARTSGTGDLTVLATLEEPPTITPSTIVSSDARPLKLGGTVQLTQRPLSEITTSVFLLPLTDSTPLSGIKTVTADVNSSTTSDATSPVVAPSSSDTSLLRNSSSTAASLIPTPTPTPVATTSTFFVSSPAEITTWTANQMAASQETQKSSNIFMPGASLFPLGVSVIVIGGLFSLIAGVMLLIRLRGWNRRRRVRGAIPSFIDVDVGKPDVGGTRTMFQPTAIAVTRPTYDDEAGAGGYAGVGARGYVVENGYTDYLPTRMPVVTDSVNPFIHPGEVDHRGEVDVPMDVGLGSPVPSFHTGRLAYMRSECGRPIADGYSVDSLVQVARERDRGVSGVGRSLTQSSTSSYGSRTTSAGSTRQPPTHFTGEAIESMREPRSDNRRSDGTWRSERSVWSSGSSGNSSDCVVFAGAGSISPAVVGSGGKPDRSTIWAQERI